MKKLTYDKMKKEFCAGVTEQGEIVFIKMEIGSCNNDHYTITHTTYCGVIDEETGEANARETLEDESYWEDCEAISKDSFLSRFIDFEKVADFVLGNDGWQNVNGEYEEIGSYKDKTYFASWSSSGASVEDLKSDYKKLFITEEERELLIRSDSLHLKSFSSYSKEDKALWKEVYAFMKRVENKELSDMEEVIPLLIDEEDED